MSGQNLDCFKIILRGFPVHESIPGLKHAVGGGGPGYTQPHAGVEEWKGLGPLLSYPAGQASLHHPLVPPGGHSSTYFTGVLVGSNEWSMLAWNVLEHDLTLVSSRSMLALTIFT